MFHYGESSLKSPYFSSEYHVLINLSTQYSRIQVEDFDKMSDPIPAFKISPDIKRTELTGRDNWPTWSYETKMYLNHRNVYFALYENFTDPDRLSRNELKASTAEWLKRNVREVGNEITDSFIEEYKRIRLKQLRDDFASFKEANKIAISVILENCSHPIRDKIAHLGLAKAMWEHLERMHKSATIGDINRVLRDLDDFRDDSGLLTGEKFIDRVEEARGDLNAWGVAIPDVYYAIVLMRGLVGRYQRKRRELHAQEVSKFNWEDFLDGMRFDEA